MNDLAYVEKKDVPQDDKALVEWLKQQPDEEKRPYLLAFADDGVIWGGFWEKTFRLSEEIDETFPKLRPETLQQAFVFGKDEELRLFKDESGQWQARKIQDSFEFIVESQVLWGDKAEKPAKNGFFYAEEYRAGIAGQWLPIERAFDAKECARLLVHHLVQVDPDTGEARIALSRLAGLSVGEKAMEVTA